MIDSLGVLLVSHVGEGGLLRIHLDGAALAQTLLLLVLVDEHETEHDEEQQLKNVGDEETADAETVLWRLVGLVEEGAGDVADAGAFMLASPRKVKLTEPDHSRDDHLLGLATSVGRDEREGEHERGLVRAREVEADQAADVRLLRGQEEAERAGNGREHEQGTNNRARVLGEAVIEQRTGGNPDNNEGTLGDAEEGSLELVLCVSERRGGRYARNRDPG